MTWIMIAIAGCQDFIQIEPPQTEIVSETVFSSDASATATVRGIYSLMMTNNGLANAAMEEYAGILSDEMTNYATRLDRLQFAQNSISPKNKELLSVFWQESYKYIGNANGVLEGLNHSTALSDAVRDQLKGEALFIKAFCNFNLVNFFGDVPYLTTTDYRENAKAYRLPASEVYLQLEADLMEGIRLLSPDFSFSNGERVQPNRGVAKALLARLYLYTEDWENAERVSSEIISQTDQYALAPDLNKVFLKNSSEAIWQLMPVVPGSNTTQAQRFILTNAPNSTSRSESLPGLLMNTFESFDNRKTKWTGTFSNASGTWYFPYKYKALSGNRVEYVMIFRLAEQYLIRAEARAHLSNINGAQEDLNTIRNRAGLGNTLATNQAALLEAIVQERRVELFAEGGHRWFDLKRTGESDPVLSIIKPGWQPTDVLLPIPDSERLLNTNLSQNPGY